MKTARDAAPSNDFSVVSRLQTTGTCTDTLAPGALFDDGAWFTGVTPGAACSWQGDGPLPASDRVGVVQEGSTTAHLWASTVTLVPGDHHRQVTRSTVSGDWAVWSETESTDLYYDNWRVFAADRRTGKPHVVATAEEFTGGKKLPFYEATYTIYQDRVFWSTTPASVAGTQKAFEPEVVSKAISGKGAIDVVAKAGDQPVTTDSGVVVRTSSKLRVNDTDDTDSPDVKKETISTGFSLVTAHGLQPLLRISPTGPIDRDQEPSAVAAHGNTLAFAVGDTEYLYDLATGTAVGFRGAGHEIAVPDAREGDSDAESEASTINSSAVTGSFATWTFGGGSGSLKAPVLVYDLKSNTLRRTWVKHNGGDVWAAGGYVGWRSIGQDSSTTTLTAWR
ncbi:hypothetical protein [Luteimicrobium xylanilyticum]|nr:hypothetical protein [Luteimicrobium xylanilyticum]